MPADLKQSGLSGRSSLLIAEDCLFVLRHGISDDRIHRLMFDKVESLATFKGPAWDRIVFGMVVVALAALWGFHEPEAFAAGPIIVGMLGAVVALYGVFRRRTIVQIYRDGRPYRFNMVAGSARVERFERKFSAAVDSWQKNLAAMHEKVSADFFSNDAILTPDALSIDPRPPAADAT